MNEKVTGIVLKQTDYRDHAVLLSVLTKEYGKLSFVANGVRRLTSKNAGSIQPYTLAEIQFDYKEGKTMFRLQTVSVRQLYRHIHEDLTASAAAGVLCETADVLNPEMLDPDLGAFTFDLLEQALGLLNEGKRSDIVIAVFLARMLSETGMGPDVDSCVLCGSGLVQAISIREGGFLCPSCAEKTGEELRSAASLRQFRLLNKASFEHYDILTASVDRCLEDCRILTGFLVRHAGLQMRSFTFYEELFALNG